MNKYGHSKNDPDYWVRISQSIWNDTGLTIDDKMKAQEELVKEFYEEKRKQKKAKTGVKAHLFANIKNAIGYSEDESEERVKKELKRLSTKSDATWKPIERKAGLSKAEILAKYNIK